MDLHKALEHDNVKAQEKGFPPLDTIQYAAENSLVTLTGTPKLIVIKIDYGDLLTSAGGKIPLGNKIYPVRATCRDGGTILTLYFFKNEFREWVWNLEGVIQR